jgi:hypothetical protein
MISDSRSFFWIPSSWYLIIITGVKHQEVGKSKEKFHGGFGNVSLEGDVVTFKGTSWMQRSFGKQ